MIYVVAFLAVGALIGCLLLLSSSRRVREIIKLGLALLDLVKLLVTLRVKAARVRSTDW